MTLKKNLNVTILAILIPVMLLLYVVLIVTLQKNVFTNAVTSFQKLSVEAQIYSINYVEREKSEATVTLQNGAPLIASYLSKRLGTRTQIIGINSEVLADTKRTAFPNLNLDIVQALDGKKAYMIEKSTSAPLLLFSSPIYVHGKVIGVVRFIHELEQEDLLISNFNKTFMISCILMFVAVALFAHRFAISLSRPIEKLRDMAQQLANGKYQCKIELQDYEEIKQLSQSFNVMAHAIELHITQLQEEKVKQKDFLDRVTHELKTPLTAIMGYANLIPRLENNQDVKDCLRHISIESERLLALVEELLKTSKYGNSPFNVSPTICDIQPILKEAVFSVQPRLNKYKITIYNHVESAKIVADQDKTKQIFLNLLDNAIKYSDASFLEFHVEIAEHSLTLVIHDDGIGISEEMLDQIKHAPPNEALQSSFGNGFGLLLCRELMKKQGGSMDIASDEITGTTVRLLFPTPAGLEHIAK
ncbi:HAMP domain-containing histidine kinase [Brevibacillus sp. 7WMA2]|uniref:sensor histidine kinase n=1 Tax=Brevibacillus TaxID=55080 RepID=UPI000BC76207|nr:MULTISPECIES: HAMP domain-containing sensor histidine kinase [Brevibacillus]AYK06003.1 sensor histidine kinase [Brevibacillus laterosporus]MBA4531680.1 HAMP domain-containing histidine kinase [Brevibacillus halotolerans]PCN45269.1 two-component sensor histidine kinase [Brevibacillus laterosporus]QIC06876.1 HAMP domain-containing histidine kinase [Brevibacillus sp. 7WMA2]WPS87759.1 HAMP domain-containing sensor histidine kinase [Brevibacillus halotolerans]